MEQQDVNEHKFTRRPKHHAMEMSYRAQKSVDPKDNPKLRLMKSLAKLKKGGKKGQGKGSMPTVKLDI